MSNFYFKDYKVNKQIHLSIGLSSNYTTKPVLSATSLRQQWMFFSLYLVKSGFYTTIMDNKLSGWTKKFQSTSWSLTCTKKRSWLLFGGLVPLWSTTTQSQQNQYIWEVCSANRWEAPKTATPAANIGQENAPSSSQQEHPTADHTTDASELEQI